MVELVDLLQLVEGLAERPLVVLGSVTVLFLALRAIGRDRILVVGVDIDIHSVNAEGSGEVRDPLLQLAQTTRSWHHSLRTV